MGSCYTSSCLTVVITLSSAGPYHISETNSVQLELFRQMFRRDGGADGIPMRLEIAVGLCALQVSSRMPLQPELITVWQVLDTSCAPVTDALVEIWSGAQCSSVDAQAPEPAADTYLDLPANATGYYSGERAAQSFRASVMLMTTTETTLLPAV